MAITLPLPSHSMDSVRNISHIIIYTDFSVTIVGMLLGESVTNNDRNLDLWAGSGKVTYCWSLLFSRYNVRALKDSFVIDFGKVVRYICYKVQV